MSCRFILAGWANFIDALIYGFSWQGNALRPGCIGGMADVTNAIASFGFVISGTLYVWEVRERRRLL